MHTVLIFSFFNSKNQVKFYIMRKYEKKFESTIIVFAQFKILFFADFFKLGGGFVNSIRTKYNPLQDAHINVCLWS